MGTTTARNLSLIGRRPFLTGAASLAGTLGPAAALADTAGDEAGLVDAARREGSVMLYTSMDLPVIEQLTRGFSATYPGITVQTQNAGGERLFQRIAQEHASNLAIADVVESTDPIHAIVWKRNGWLAPGLPDEVTRLWPATERDPDGCFATFRLSVSPLGYNTKYTKPADVPASFADMLNPKWANRLVKSHPGYAGITMAGTFELSRLLGWDWFRQLAKLHVMQVQSATECPRKIASGERLALVDCSEYVLLRLRAAGAPVQVVYPAEGTPTSQGNLVVMRSGPHPNAARLLQRYLFSEASQQAMVDVGLLRSVRPNLAVPPGVQPLSGLKLLQADPTALEAAAESVTRTYAQIFGV